MIYPAVTAIRGIYKITTNTINNRKTRYQKYFYSIYKLREIIFDLCKR